MLFGTWYLWYQSLIRVLKKKRCLFSRNWQALPLLHSSSQQLLWADCKGGNTPGKGDDLHQPVFLHTFVAREGKHLPRLASDGSCFSCVAGHTHGWRSLGMAAQLCLHITPAFSDLHHWLWPCRPAFAVLWAVCLYSHVIPFPILKLILLNQFKHNQSSASTSSKNGMSTHLMAVSFTFITQPDYQNFIFIFISWFLTRFPNLITHLFIH